MVPLAHLWLPILVSAVIVFVGSAILHMVLKYHNSDYKPFANEDEVRAAIRKGSPAPGQYALPYCMGPKDMEKPEMARKFEEGPVGLVLLKAPGPVSMGPMLGQWFVFVLVISALVAYVAAQALVPGAPYRVVFCLVASAAFLAYGGAQAQFAIWGNLPWSVTIKNLIDSLVYALLTAGTFGWLWPKM